MTIISLPPSFLAKPLGRRKVILFMALLRRLLDSLVASDIARHERRASKAVLRRFTDDELKDIGIRGEIGHMIDRAARMRRSRRS